MARTNKLQFFYQSPGALLNNRSTLKAFINSIFKKEKKNLGFLNIIFCDDKRLRDINREYLDHDYFTDIVSFDLSPDPSRIEGEIYISIDRVRENAKIYHSTIKEELHRVIFHGVLHLCGYGDKTESQIKKMRVKEKQYLAAYFS